MSQVVPFHQHYKKDDRPGESEDSDDDDEKNSNLHRRWQIPKVTPLYMVYGEESVNRSRLRGGKDDSDSDDDDHDFYTMGHDGELDICGKFIKCCMFVANIIMFIGGVVIVILGVWTIQEKGFINALVGTNTFLGAVYILIFCGVALCGVSFSGCLASVREMKCLLLTYALSVFILLVVILISGILAYTFRDNVRFTMQQEMYSSIKTYGEEKTLSRAWDDIQEVLECCGVMSYTDWKGHIPESCCRLSSGKRVNCKVFQTSLNIWKNGCLNVTEEFIRAHAAIIAGAAVTVSALMMIGFIFSLIAHRIVIEKENVEDEIEDDI